MTFQVTIMFGVRLLRFLATIKTTLCGRFVFDAITTASSILKCRI